VPEIEVEETKVTDDSKADDVPFEINRPKKEEDDPNQMSLF